MIPPFPFIGLILMSMEGYYLVAVPWPDAMTEIRSWEDSGFTFLGFESVRDLIK